MTITGTIECTLPDLTEVAETVVRCTSDAANNVTAWDVGSTVANWGILLIAAMALIVSFKSRKDARVHMEATLDQNYRATQAQIDASREAVLADLDERRNARELDITADFVTAIDHLQATAVIPVTDEGRTHSVRQAAAGAMAAAGRYSLFVMHSKTIMDFLAEYVEMLDEFTPSSDEDFESRDFERLVRVQTVLRAEIVDFQESRQHTGKFMHVFAAISAGRLEILDHLLDLEPDERIYPKEE